MHQYYNDDIIGNAFSYFGTSIQIVASSLLTPWYEDTFVPYWNKTMKSKSFRVLLAAICWIIFGVAAKKWAEEAYEFFKARHTKGQD